MKMLSRAEEIILLTILKLKDEAYGVKIREQIFLDTQHNWSFASIYTPLDKLTRKNYVKKIKGEATNERGGKSKFYYQLTKQGVVALQEIQKINSSCWTGITPELLK